MFVNKLLANCNVQAKGGTGHNDACDAKSYYNSNDCYTFSWELSTV